MVKKNRLSATRITLPLILLGILTIPCPGWAQTELEDAEGREETENFRPYHSVTVVMSHVHIREALANGEKGWLEVPGWGLDYNYIFHPRWAIGLHTDFIFEEFLVENRRGEEEAIERSYPVAPALMVSWEAFRHWIVMFGPGVEITKGENFFLNRLGVEFGTEMGERGWEFLALLQYDFRYDAYDTFLLGVGVGKIFGE